MKQSEEMSIFDELNDRLDDFFDDIEEEGPDALGIGSVPAPVAPVKVNRMPGRHSRMGLTGIDQIKAIVLEMEWEISDETIDGFLFEVAQLASMGSGDRVVFLFLKLLTTMGQYIKVKRSSANPEYILLFKNLFASFCRVMEEGELSTRERNALLLEAVDNFKVFKSRVVPGYVPATAAVGTNALAVEEKSGHLSDEMRRYIRDTIKAELSGRLG